MEPTPKVSSLSPGIDTVQACVFKQGSQPNMLIDEIDSNFLKKRYSVKKMPSMLVAYGLSGSSPMGSVRKLQTDNSDMTHLLNTDRS